MNAIKTQILKVKGDWKEILNDCRSTVGKAALDKEPSEKFKKSILIAEHSPIRDIIIKWFWKGLPHWIAGHYARHKWEKFIRSQRIERNGVPRDQLSQTEPQNFTGEANIQHLIDTAKKRLCRTASPETRAQMEDLKTTIHDEIDPYIANVLVPSCVYRCGCPEQYPCAKHNYYERLLEKNPKVGSHNIQERYDAYNEIFYSKENI